MNEVPALSVVVGTRDDVVALRSCLRALDAQRGDGFEVVLAAGSPLPGWVASDYPWVRTIERPGALVPELWREGIRATRGELVGLTTGAMVVGDDWASRLRALLAERSAVAGAIEPADRLRLRDRGEYLCRYARDMLPFAARRDAGMPGDNCGYRRAALELVGPSWSDGFWEPEVNRALDEGGVEPWHTPELIVAMGRSAGARAFVRQRLLHGRAYGRQRGRRFGSARNLAGLLAAPIVPALMTVRVARELLARRRLIGWALPAAGWLVLFNVAWAAGEAGGHLDALRGRA